MKSRGFFMPLVPALIKKKAETAALNALTSSNAANSKDNPEASKTHKNMAAAIAAAVEVVITSILSDAQVAPGIPVVTAGSPAAQSGATTSPGKIL